MHFQSWIHPWTQLIQFYEKYGQIMNCSTWIHLWKLIKWTLNSSSLIWNQNQNTVFSAGKLCVEIIFSSVATCCYSWLVLELTIGWGGCGRPFNHMLLVTTSCQLWRKPWKHSSWGIVKGIKLKDTIEKPWWRCDLNHDKIFRRLSKALKQQKGR